MPRYLRIADIPAILKSIENKIEPEFQLDRWQKQWVVETDGPVQSAAILSYRWRNRGAQEDLASYLKWMSDVGHCGYNMEDVKKHVTPEWEVVSAVPLQIEVAVWMLWLHATSKCEYVWIDQMCVPQDADVEIKMHCVRESLGIYKAGQVFIVLAPVVDYSTGAIMLANDAAKIVDSYKSEFRRGDLGEVAKKALLVNSSYMRRVWTIQEAVAAQGLLMWPMKGNGRELNSYQSLYVIDWPQFNAWNGWPGLGALREVAASNKAVQTYLDGDFTEIVRVLREHPSDGIAYLAMMSKEIMWITMDRNGLVNDLRSADEGKVAHAVLNSHQVMDARSFLAEDKVLALVPLISYDRWIEAMKDVPGSKLVQASVDWAWGILEEKNPSYRWSIRMYNSHKCAAAHLSCLTPRRNLSNGSSRLGTAQGARLVYEPAVGGLDLDDGSKLEVVHACYMPHPGVPGLSWGPSHMPWTTMRDALGTDEGFRLAFEHAAEFWLEPAEFSHDTVAVLLAKSPSLRVGLVIVVALKVEDAERTTGQVMMVVDVALDAIDAVAAGLRAKASAPFTAQQLFITSPGIPPAPAPAPAASEPQQPAETPVEENKAPVEAEGKEPGSAATDVEVTAPAAAAAAAEPAPAAPAAAPAPAAVSSDIEVAPAAPAAAAPAAPQQQEAQPQQPAHQYDKITKGGDQRVENSGVEVAAGPAFAGYQKRDDSSCRMC